MSKIISENPRRNLILGAAWAVAMRWSIKGLGLVSTMVLARILMPSDYGVVAMSMLVVGLIESLIDFGVDTNLLRLRTIDRDDIDSAWSMRIIQGTVVAILLAGFAPLAAQYFNEVRIVPIIRIFAGCLLIASFSNIGLVLARREFQFNIEFRYNIFVKILGVIITIVSALILRDYRALVIGIAVGYVFGFLFSYVIHPYRPRWNTSKIASMWLFSKWLIVYWIANYAARKSDELIAGRMFDAGGLGVYAVASDIGQMATAEIGPPLMRSLLPTLSSIQDEPERMKSGLMKTISTINTVTLALGFGLAAVSKSATIVLLGNNWAEAAGLIAIFAIVGAIKISIIPIPSFLLITGETRLHAILMWLEFFSFLIAAAFLGPKFGVIGLAYARLVSVTCNLFFNVAVMMRRVDVGVFELLSIFWRPVVGVMLMCLGIEALSTLDLVPLYRLIASIVVGGSIYGLWVIVSWSMFGRPDGLESLAFKFFEKHQRKDRGR